MALKETLQKVLNEYPLSKTQPLAGHPLATFRRKNEVRGCCGRIAQGMENCKVGRI
jgi:hypothetical protein